MPKEYIVTKDMQRRLDEHGGECEAVRVGWWADCAVQIATVLKAPVEGSTSRTEAPVDQGQFVNLDRDACNELIRLLRKARDVAFGKDA